MRASWARSSDVMRMAPKPAHSPSSSRRASNISASCGLPGRATTALRCGRASTRPLETSSRRASRTGVRETLKRRASSISSSVAPGASAPRTMSSEICMRKRSAKVLGTGLGSDGKKAPGLLAARRPARAKGGALI